MVAYCASARNDMGERMSARGINNKQHNRKKKSSERGRRFIEWRLAPRRKMLFEPMEPRLLLSADTNVAAGLLTATFHDPAAVEIKLGATTPSDNGGVIVNLKYDGADHAFGDSTDGVTSVILTGSTGDDTFTLADKLGISLTIHGDGGADTIVGPDSGMK